MNIVNNEFIKFDEFTIFCEIVKASDENNDNKLEFFQKIISTIMKYKKENKTHSNEFYIRITDLENQEYIKIQEIPVERQTILNAILFAAYNNDIDMLNKLTLIPIQKYELSQEELGENLDYILTHSMDINEYIYGEEDRIVYNIKESKLEKTYVFKEQQQKSYQRIKIK